LPFADTDTQADCGFFQLLSDTQVKHIQGRKVFANDNGDTLTGKVATWQPLDWGIQNGRTKINMTPTISG
jgi:hypothetical protein